MIRLRRSFIVGLKGQFLTSKEISFLKRYKPWGVILFSRNIKSIKQTQKLTSDIKRILRDKNYPILIDQEGGKINRLKKFIDTSKFSSEFFNKLYLKNKRKFYIYYDVYINQISYLLNLLGININTVPVLDVRRPNSNKIIGDRSYSSNPKNVSIIGKYCIKKFHQNGIATVIKHIPGHGLAKSDSHKKLPIVKQNIKQLNKIDFYPFKKQSSFLAMTAHILYKSIDNKYSATHSPKIIKIIRNKIGFKNILISDDLSMKSLKGNIKDNTIKTFNAGCNLAMHCNGNIKEMEIVGQNSPLLDRFIIKKTSQFYKILS